jgi:predicted RNase H-like HicB family nuclease
VITAEHGERIRRCWPRGSPRYAGPCGGWIGRRWHEEWPCESPSTLEFWRDGDWSVGRLLEVPGVFSQRQTLEELRENIQDAYDLMVTQDRPPAPLTAQQQLVELEVGNAKHLWWPTTSHGQLHSPDQPA